MRHFARPFVIPFALCWLLLVFSAPAVFAQKRKTPTFAPAPPPVVAREVTVMEGESVTIPLGIHGRRTGQLEFLIRNPPKAGKLSAITLTGVNSGTVVYTPKRGTVATEDRFAYAVRSHEGVSAPGVVSIKLIPKPKLPPRLDVPESLTFPATLAGETSEMTFEISNPGSSMVSGNMTVSPPWSLEGDGAYRLGSHASATFKLAFRPERTGMISGEIVLGPEPRRVIALSGEGKPPFVVRPAILKIGTSPNGRTRMAKLEIENLSDEPRTIAVAADARLMTEKTVEIAGGQKAQVPVFAEPGDGSGFQDVLRLSAGEWKGEVSVEVEPLQHRLKLATDPAAELRGIAGRPIEFGVIVENEGGRAAAAVLTVNQPFLLSASRLALGPTEKKRVTVTGNGLGEGEHRVEVTAETDTTVERLKVAYVAATEPRPAAGPTRAGSVSPVAAESPEPRAPTLAAGVEAGDDESFSVAAPSSVRMEEHPNAFGKLGRATGATTATIEWPIALADAADLAVEERILSLRADREFVTTWQRLASVTFKTEGDKRRAELTHLTPAKTYTVRVRGEGRTFFTTQFTTETKPPFLAITTQGSAAVALLVLLAAVAWWRWKNRRRSAW